MEVKPMRGKLIVKPSVTREDKLKTASGIILTETQTDMIAEGVIVAMGSPTLSTTQVEIPYEVAMGDKILYKQYGKERVEIAEVEHRIIIEEDILLILSPDKVAKKMDL